jgi:flagellin-like hook-associated protein FlgL
MGLRISTNTGYLQLLRGLRTNQYTLAKLQQQGASGLRVLSPSDDPAALGRAVLLRQRSAEGLGTVAGLSTGLTEVDLAASTLQEGVGLMAEARALALQGMNGTLSAQDRESVAAQLEMIRTQLLEVANHKLEDRYLFGGTSTQHAPYESAQIAGLTRALYRGDSGVQHVRIGSQGTVAVNAPGDAVFSAYAHSGVQLHGDTGLALGSDASQGSGIEQLELRHDSSALDAPSASGLALVDGGAHDTLLGVHALVIDATARTIQLGNGPAIALPPPGDPALANVQVENELGGLAQLDLSAWDGLDLNGTLTGNGSISIDGSSWQTLDFTQTNASIAHAATGSVLRLDLTQLQRAGTEKAVFGGAVNSFDALQGMVDLLRSGEELTDAARLEQLGEMLGELDRNSANVLSATGRLGLTSARMDDSRTRLLDGDVRLRSLIADQIDADYTEIATDLAQTQLALQTVLSAGARIMQTNLLNFLR